MSRPSTKPTDPQPGIVAQWSAECPRCGWRCLAPGCPEHGDTDASEKRHREATQHASATASTVAGAAAIAARVAGRVSR